MFVLPIVRDNDVENTPRFVVFLMLVNSLLLVLTYTVSSPQVAFKEFGFTPAHPTLLTVFTSMFLHAGFWHLAGNLWFLWMFGKDVENSVGTWLFILIYLLSGFGSTLLHYLFNLGSNIPCVGASGAISGVVGCFFVLFPKAEFDLVIYFGVFRLKTISAHTKSAIGAWIGEQALLGLLSQAVHFSSVAFWGHVGGFVVGVSAAFCFKYVVPINAEGLPLVRPWYIPTQIAKERNDIIRLGL